MLHLLSIWIHTKQQFHGLCDMWAPPGSRGRCCSQPWPHGVTVPTPEHPAATAGKQGLWAGALLSPATSSLVPLLRARPHGLDTVGRNLKAPVNTGSLPLPQDLLYSFRKYLVST